jgi:hypothetical protein
MADRWVAKIKLLSFEELRNFEIPKGLISSFQ